MKVGYKLNVSVIISVPGIFYLHTLLQHFFSLVEQKCFTFCVSVFTKIDHFPIHLFLLSCVLARICVITIVYNKKKKEYVWF